MGKIGPKFSQIVSVRLEGVTPPQSGQPDPFSQFFLFLPLLGSELHSIVEGKGISKSGCGTFKPAQCQNIIISSANLGWIII